MLDVHPPHAPTHTWKDFFIHVGTICVGLLIAVGLEQTVEAIHHHHQREQLDRDLLEESQKNLQSIDHDLHFDKFETRYNAIADTVSTTRGSILRLTLPPLPCLPGAFADGSMRLVLPYENAWITARDNGIAALLPAQQTRIYYRRSVLFELIRRTTDQLYDNCPRLNAMQRRLAHRSSDGKTFDWTLTPMQAEELGAYTSQQAATIKALCFRLRYLRAFEQDLLDDGHRINGAPLDKSMTDMLDQEDLPPSR